MRLIHLASAVALAACSASRPPAAESEPERVVQARHDAYNRRDLGGLLAVYTPDAVSVEHPADTVFRGATEIRRHYEDEFRLMPRVRVRVRERRTTGRAVVEELRYRGFPCGGTYSERVTYHVEDGRIRSATREPLSEYPGFSIVPGWHVPICPRAAKP